MQRIWDTHVQRIITYVLQDDVSTFRHRFMYNNRTLWVFWGEWVCMSRRILATCYSTLWYSNVVLQKVGWGRR